MCLLKQCSVCKEVVLLSGFAKHKLGKQGLRSYCKVCSNKYSKRYHEENRETICSKKRVSQLVHYRNNKEQYYTRNAERRALLSEHPLWDNDLTLFVFEEALLLRKLRENATKTKWHVDHIIPLKGKFVYGLHVWNNFQLLPARLNLRKNNRMGVTNGW